MKGNLKGLSGIKGLMLKHGEKLGITVVGLLALYFVYGSLSLPKLDDKYQAPQLQQEITQTNAAIDDFDWQTAVSDHPEKIRREVPIEKSADLTVKPESYAIDPNGLNRAVIPPALRRTDPVLLNAVEVRAIGGTGLFAFVDEQIRKAQALRFATEEAERAKEQQKELERQQQQPEGQGGRRRDRGGPGEFGMEEVDPDHPNRRMVDGSMRAAGVPLQGGERIERAYWATIVAKVPIREQLKQYQDAFSKARGYDPTRDFPQYLGYFVQRAEVERGKPLEWKPVHVYDAQQKNIQANKPIDRAVTSNAVTKLMESATENWAGQAIEPVDPRAINPLLTLSLPPLVGRDFAADATHPDIPLAINAMPEVEPQPEAEEQPAVKPAEGDDRAMFGMNTGQQMIGGQRGYGMPGGMPGGGRGRGYGGEYPGGMRGMGGPESGMAYGGGMMAGGVQGSLPYGVDFYLLRFLDYTVEPGKKYKYRVRIVLADPNFGLPDNSLDAAVLDRLAGKRASATSLVSPRFVDEWSDPSPTVGIPVSGAVQVANAKLPNPNLHNDEPTVKLMVETFDVDATEGSAVHIAKEKDFRRGYVVNMNEEMNYIGEGGRWIDQYDSYALQTGVTVLDVEGADRLTKDFAAPTRVLLMDPSGELSIRSELDDSMSVKYLRNLFAEPDKRRGGEPGMMRGQMPGGPGFQGGRGRGR